MNQTLTITDFKLFEHQQIRIKNLTVLAGINSAGKSTIIQAILLLRNSLDERKKVDKEISRFPVPLNGPFNLQLGNTYEVIRRAKRLADSEMRLGLYSETIEQSISITFSGDRSVRTNYQLWVEDIKSEGGNLGILHPHFYYLCAERIGPRLKYEYDLLSFPHVGYRGQNTFQLLSGDNIVVNESKSFDPKNPGFLLAETRLWLNYVIPGANFENALAVGRSRVIEGTFAESLPTNVGFGISYVIPIIVNGLLAEPDTIFIVENPEAHLHPLGQSRIGKFLAHIAGTDVNVIVETHSEHVINGIRIASLTGKVSPHNVIVNYVTNEATDHPIVDEIELTEMGDLTSYPKGFFDQEQADIATIIRERRKML